MMMNQNWLESGMDQKQIKNEANEKNRMT